MLDKKDYKVGVELEAVMAILELEVVTALELVVVVGMKAFLKKNMKSKKTMRSLHLSPSLIPPTVLTSTKSCWTMHSMEHLLA
jgi:hypothetical protein